MASLFSSWERLTDCPNNIKLYCKNNFMKLLLVLGDEDTYKLITRYVKPLGFELIRYTHVLKAMDNIDEIDPQAIIISARDYPRHWKIMAKFVRNERGKDACPFIVLKGKNFPIEEASKASFLGVSGLVSETLDNSAEVSRLQGILSRYMPVEEKRRTRRFYTEPWHRFGFTFSSPDDHTLITGKVKDISSGGLSFLPDNPVRLKDIAPNTELEECSLRAGDSLLSPICHISIKSRIISLVFFSFPDGEQEILNNYLESLPLKELDRIKKNHADIPSP